MTDTPFTLIEAFRLWGQPISWTVLTTWGIMLFLGLGSALISRRLNVRPGRLQVFLELFVVTIDDQITATLPGPPDRFRALIGTLFLFILTANWCSLIPGIDPPTAHLETGAALAGIVFVATIAFGIRSQGLGGYLRAFARPNWAMIPLNLIEQVTRILSLMVRLFGNVMSGVFVVGIVLSLAGLLVPIPLMALDLLTGAVQAYIFAILALVFIASAVEGGGHSERTPTQ